MSRRGKRADDALPEELRTNSSAKSLATPDPDPVRPPEHAHALAVPGTTGALLRFTRRALHPTAWFAVGTTLIVLGAVYGPDARTRIALVTIGSIAIAVTIRVPLAAARAWRYAATRPWRYYAASTYVTDSVAGIEMRVDTNDNVSYFAAAVSRHRRDVLRSPMFRHVWFAGDFDGSGRGIIVPAGGGPLIFVRRRAALRSPVASGRVKLVRFGSSPRRLKRLQERYDRIERQRQTATDHLLANATSRTGRKSTRRRAAPRDAGAGLPKQLTRRGQKLSGFVPTADD